MAEHPKVFISYSHDSPEHKQWVLELGTKLVQNGVDVVLDRWDLTPGDDRTLFMERGVKESDRVLVICTDSYVRKANDREGGVGYEQLIVTAQLARDLGTDKFIPIIRQASGEEKTPTFLETRVYIDFTNDNQFDERFDELLRELHQAPIIEKPPLGGKPSFPKQEVLPSEGTDAQLPEILERDDSDLSLTTPAATEATPATAVIMCHHRGRLVPGVELLVLFPNKTWKPATTDENGEVQVNLHSTHLPMTVFAAAPSYAAHLKHAWVPDHGPLTIELKSLPNGGAEIFPKGTGHLPGLSGRLNPIRDTLDRTYLHAPEIAVNEGQQQPVPFTPEKDLHLTDAEERELIVRIVEIVGRAVLVEYRPYLKGDGK